MNVVVQPKGQEQSILPTADETFGSTTPPVQPKEPGQHSASKQLPTADEAFGPVAPQQQQSSASSVGSVLENVRQFNVGLTKPLKQIAEEAKQHPSSGALSDYIWSFGNNGNLINAFGVGAAHGWGDEPLGTPEADEWLRKAGVFNDYKSGQTNIIKGVNEALIRPPLMAGQLLFRGIGALFGGAEQTAAQWGENIGQPELGRDIAGLVEKEYMTGGTNELVGGGFHSPSYGQLINTARAERDIGESRTPTEEQIKERDAAVGAQEPPPPKDINELARRMHPDLFDEHDAILNLRNQAGVDLDQMGAARVHSPEAVQAQSDIDSILGKVKGVEDRLSNKQFERLADARDRLNKALWTDTDEMSAMRMNKLDLQHRLFDLGPQVSAALRQAQEHMPQMAEKFDNEVDTERAPLVQDTAPAADGFDIAKDASEKFQRAGRPVDEADALGRIISNIYHNRVAAFEKGQLGTAEDLYKSQFDIRAAESYSKMQKGEVFFQDPKDYEGFYSGLTRAVEGLKQTKAGSQEWAGIIDGLKNKGVKPEEIDSSFVHDWLEGQKGSITKEELLDYLNKARPNITEHWREKDDFDSEVKYGSKKWSHAQDPSASAYHETTFSVPPELKHDARDRLTKLQQESPLGTDWVLRIHEAQMTADAEIESNEKLIKQSYKESHFPERNIIAHERSSEHFEEDPSGPSTDSDGKKGYKTLVVNEVQSQLHQKGNDVGYRDKDIEAKHQAAQKTVADIEQQMKDVRDRQADLRKIYTDAWAKVHTSELNSSEYNLFQSMADDAHEKNMKLFGVTHELIQKKYEADKIASSLAWEIRNPSKVPDLPFKGWSWAHFVMKRMIKYAVDNGFDRIAWDTGTTNARRYGLGQLLSKIEMKPSSNGSRQFDGKTFDIEAFDKKGNRVKNWIGVRDPKELERYLGKDVAERLMSPVNINAIKDREANRVLGRFSPFSSVIRLQEEGLEGGGKFHKILYDKVIPNFMNSYTKKWGAEVKEGEVHTGVSSPLLRDQDQNRETFPVHQLDITPEMKESVRTKGQPLFQRGSRGALTVDEAKHTLWLFRNADASTAIHEFGHHLIMKLFEDASHPEAPEWLRRDAQTMREFLKVKDGEVLTKAQHERGARSFERYFWEGVAPSKSMAGIFARFKEWMMSVYATLKKINAPMSPAVRDIFNRAVDNPHSDTIIAAEHRPPETNFERLQQTAFGQAGRRSGRGLGGRPIQKQAPMSLEPQETLEGIGTQTAQPLAGSPFSNVASRSSEIKATEAPTRATEVGPGLDEVSTEQPPTGSVEAPRPLPTESAANTASKEETTTQSTDPTKDLPKSGTEYVSKAGKINLKHVTNDDELADALHDIIEDGALDLKVRRDKITRPDVMEFGEAVGLDPQKADEALAVVEQFADRNHISVAEALYGVKRLMIQAAADVVELAGGDIVPYIAARQRLLKITEPYLKGGANWAWIGHSLQIDAQAAEKAQELSTFLQSNLNKSFDQIKDEMEKVKLLNNPSEISRFVQKNSAPTWGNMANEVFTNYLISGPFTHLRYAVGNELYSLYKAGYLPLVRAGVNVVHTALAKEGVSVEPIYARESLEGLSGWYFGSVDGMRGMKDAFKAGGSMSLRLSDLAEEMAFYEQEKGIIGSTVQEARARVKELTDKPTKAMLELAEPPQNLYTKNKSIPGIAGSIIRAPGERMVAPIHTFNYIVGLRQNMNILTYRMARAETEAKMAAGTLTEDQYDSAFTDRLAQIRYDPPLELVKQAKVEALEQSLMSPAERGFTKNLTNLVNTEVWGFRPLRFIQPFLGIRSNILRIGIENSPFAYTLKTVRDDLSGKDTVAFDDAMAKMIAGSSVYAAIGALWYSGHANGPPPRDWKEAVVDKMANGLPYSVTVGHMAYEIKGLGVFGDMFGLATSLYQYGHDLSDEDFSKATWTLAYNMGRMVTAEGPISGFSDILTANADPEHKGQSWINNFLSSFSPFSVGGQQIEQYTDPYQRDVHGLLESFERKIPGVAELTLYPKVDLFGQPVPSREFMGVYAEKIAQDPVWKAFEGAKYFPAQVKRDIDGVPLTDKQYHEYATKSGIIAKQLMTAYVSNPGWNQLPTKMKHDFLSGAVSSARSLAGIAMKAEYGTPDTPADQNILLQSQQNRQKLLTGN